MVGRIVRPEEIEDIVQEAFVTSYAASRTQEIRNPQAFMMRVARNLALEPAGVRFDLEATGEQHDVTLAIPGRHNALNALAALEGKAPVADYDGYGSCPLTVEAGKVVLAEFGYGGKLLPSFPNWLIDGTRPSRLSWLLKDTILPPIYWHGMLKGREWMAKPHMIEAAH